MKRCQSRFTIAREKKPDCPGLSPTHQLLAPTERRGRHRLVFLFNCSKFSSAPPWFFGPAPLQAGSSIAEPERKHQPRLLFDSGRGLETHQPVLALANVVAILKGAVEKRFHPVIVILLPAWHLRVIVALRATDIHTKIHADVVGQPVEIADAVAVKFSAPFTASVSDLARIISSNTLSQDRLSANAFSR